MNNNKLSSGPDGVCPEKTWGEIAEPVTVQWVLEGCVGPTWEWTNSWQQGPVRVIRNTELNFCTGNSWSTVLWKLEKYSRKLFDFCLFVSVGICSWPLCFCAGTCPSSASVCLVADNCSTVCIFLNITPTWPFTKSCFNPVHLRTAVCLLTAEPQSLSTSSIFGLISNHQARIAQLFFQRSGTCSLPCFIWKKAEYSITSQPVVSMMIKISQPFFLFT